MMVYRQSVKDTHRLILRQATGLTNRIVTTIQAIQAVAMVAIMNMNQPITTIIMVSTQEVITVRVLEVAITVAIIIINTIIMKQTLSLGA